MKISRRAAFKSASIAAGALLGNFSKNSSALAQEASAPLPTAFSTLKPLGDRVKPIRPEEFQARIARRN